MLSAIGLRERAQPVSSNADSYRSRYRACGSHPAPRARHRPLPQRTAGKRAVAMDFFAFPVSLRLFYSGTLARARGEHVKYDI